MPSKKVAPVKNELVEENSDDLITSEEVKTRQSQNTTTQNQEAVNNTVDEIKTQKNNEVTPFFRACDEYLERLNRNYREHRDEVKRLMKLHRQEVRSLTKNARKRRHNKKTGFTNPEVVPEQLATLVGVQVGATMPRTELTGRIYRLLDERGLRYEKDRRVFRADNEIMKIFNLPESVNQVTDPKDKSGFNFYNLQSYMARLYPEKETVQQTTTPAPVQAPAQAQTQTQTQTQAPAPAQTPAPAPAQTQKKQTSRSRNA